MNGVLFRSTSIDVAGAFGHVRSDSVLCVYDRRASGVARESARDGDGDEWAWAVGVLARGARGAHAQQMRVAQSSTRALLSGNRIHRGGGRPGIRDLSFASPVVVSPQRPVGHLQLEVCRAYHSGND